MTAAGLRRYLLVVLGGLLIQGLGSLLFRLAPALPEAAPYLLRGLFGIDAAHAVIHIAWGAGGVALLLVRRTASVAIGLALVFGVFYTAFAVLGLSLHHPFGLELDLIENGFHAVVGPLTVLLGGLALRRLRATAAPVIEPLDPPVARPGSAAAP